MLTRPGKEGLSKLDVHAVEKSSTHKKDAYALQEAQSASTVRKGVTIENMQCFSKVEAEVSSDGHIYTAFLDTVLAGPAKFNSIGVDTIFKLDTGAEVTAISEDSFQCLGRLVLTKPDRMLYGPLKQPLNVKGRFDGTFRYKGHSVQQLFSSRD